ncbi:hypothetical protein HY839_04720 [Candidatus Azambacteria bacterium]|nr:hypothetical protein [Candidatus Azambacteria bacterium]
MEQEQKTKGMLHPFTHHYHHHYRLRFPIHHKKIFIFDAALVATGLILGAFATYYFLQRPTFRPLDISITTQDQKITIGAEHLWEVRITNISNKTIRGITTTLTFPASFKIISPADADSSLSKINTSTSTAARVWKIDALTQHEHSSLEVRGVLFAPVGETIKIIVRTAGATDSKEPFSETTVLELRATDPALVTTVEFPQSVFAGESFPFTVTYANASATTLERPILRFETPSSFALNNKPSSWKDGSIILPTLAQGARGSMELNGLFTADSHVSRVSIGVRTSAELNGKRVSQEDILPSLEVKPTGIKILLKSVEANGTPGEPLHLIVSLEHTGSDTFQTVSVCVPLNLNLINKESVKGDGKLADTMYCFTPAQRAELTEIKNGFHGEWPLTFSLQNTPTLTDTETNKNAVLAFTPRVSLTAQRAGATIKLSLVGSELRVPLTTTLTLKTMGRYFTNEGDQLGRGPLPPQAGKTTKYWIAWAIRSSTNPVKNLIIRAILPSSIQWSGKSTVNKGKNMIYDPITREVRWTHELLESTADGCACAEGGFEVSLTPSVEDIGTVSVLIKNISADGIDIWTDAPVHAAAPDITANLIDDPLAQGKGRVQK